MSFTHLKLKIVDSKFKYVLLKDFKSLTRLANSIMPGRPSALFMASEEASAIVPSETEVEAIKTESNWACVQVVGEMPFGTVQGLIASISATLNSESIGICVVSTFLTDWFFVKSNQMDKAVAALKNTGWEFVP